MMIIHRRMNISIKIGYFILGLMFFPSILFADTRSAASCSKIDVDSAITSATSGDTVLIPAGSCTWSSALAFNKGIILLGAGEGVTTISGGKFTVSVPDGQSWRLSGMTINDNGGSGIAISGASKAFRVDHITFNDPTGHAQGRLFWVQPSGGYNAHLNGVIDHITINNAATILFHFRANSTDGGNAEWDRTISWGSADAVYVEDSSMTWTRWTPTSGVSDCEGGNYVFRHNNVTNGYIEQHGGNNGYRGCRKWEIYENNFISTDPANYYWAMHLRAGIGVVWGNTFTGTMSAPPITFTYYRSYQAGEYPMSNTCSNSVTPKVCVRRPAFQACTTDADCAGDIGSCVSIDNPSDPIGHPCRDQFGWDGNKVRTPRPILAWNNKLNGSFIDPRIIDGTSGPYVQSGRDYCSNSSSMMPSSCNGVTTTYVPYTYPHPFTINLPISTPGLKLKTPSIKGINL